MWGASERSPHGSEVVVRRATTRTTGLTDYPGQSRDPQPVEFDPRSVQQTRRRGREIVVVTGDSGETASGCSHASKDQISRSKTTAFSRRWGAIEVSRQQPHTVPGGWQTMLSQMAEFFGHGYSEQRVGLVIQPGPSLQVRRRHQSREDSGKTAHRSAQERQIFARGFASIRGVPMLQRPERQRLQGDLNSCSPG